MTTMARLGMIVLSPFRLALWLLSLLRLFVIHGVLRVPKPVYTVP